MPRLSRLDAELVRRGLARSREHAGRLILEGRVSTHGKVATKAATRVSTDAPLAVTEPGGSDYASRGGYKLAGVLDTLAPLGLQVADRGCLDAGASTGGFTDVLLRRHAARVVAVDVGYGQLIWRLQQDDRVLILDRVNVRDLTLDLVGAPVDLVVADLSFISLRIVLPALISVCQPDGDLLLMVKPQFEVGRGGAKKGVVRDPALRVEAIAAVAAAAARQGWGTRAVVASSLPGPAGNVEYFLWLRLDADPLDRDAARAAVAAGPTGERLEP